MIVKEFFSDCSLKVNINISYYNDFKVALFNIDKNNDNKADFNLINQDTDNDGKCDLNCDINNDDKCDVFDAIEIAKKTV